MSRLFTAIILLLMTGVALAADTGGLATAHSFALQLTPPDSDYSVAYLGQIFGTVGNVLHGTSGQILGKMFAIFNKGVLVVAALWLGYTVITTVLQAAHEGTASSHNRKITLTMLRIAFGFSLMIPSSTTGYSALQDIFMKVVVQGVGLADQVWNTALDYIQYGGSLYIPPSQMNTDPDVISTALGTSTSNSSLGYISKIFRDEVCMIESDTWEKSDTSNPQYTAQLAAAQSTPQTTVTSPILTSMGTVPAGGTGSFDYHPVYYPKMAGGVGMVYFPGVGSPNNEGNSNCGTATSYSNSTVMGTGSTVTDDQLAHFEQISFSALKQVVISLLPAAQSYVTAEQNNSNTPELDAFRQKTIFSAILAYTNLITPYQKLLQNVQSAAVQKSLQNMFGVPNQQGFMEEAKAQGWIMAGGFYWSVEESNNKASTIDVSKLTPTVADPVMLNPFPTEPNHNQNVLIGSSNTITGYVTPITALWSTYVGAQQNTITGSSSSSGGSYGNAAADALFGKLSALSAANVSSPLFYLSGNYNPISVLMKMGNSLLTTVVSIWIAIIVVSFFLGLAAGFCESTSPAGEAFRSGLAIVKSIMMLVTGTILVPGAILAYYVPMYPFLVFTFAAIGWILLVVEGMAAAPLVCAGLTHPEGHDFLGKAEQALMLFLSIFLRPALMIIGLIASMVVSFVAFHMMLSGFGVIVHSLSSTAAFGNGLLVVINSVMVIVIFAMITMEVIEQSFKLVFQLPNNIMTWIGAPTTGEDYGKMAQGVQGAISGAAQGMGKAAETGQTISEESGKITGDIARDQQQKQSESNIDTKGGGGKQPPGGGGMPGGGPPALPGGVPPEAAAAL